MDLPDISALFTPLKLGPLTLKSRFVMPPMQRGWVDDGAPLDRYIPYYTKRVRNGIGLVIVESTAIDHPSSTGQVGATRISRATIPAWKRVVDSVHAENGAIFIQLWHEGSMRKEGKGRNPEQPSLSASGIVQPGRIRAMPEFG